MIVRADASPQRFDESYHNPQSRSTLLPLQFTWPLRKSRNGGNTISCDGVHNMTGFTERSIVIFGGCNSVNVHLPSANSPYQKFVPRPQSVYRYRHPTLRQCFVQGFLRLWGQWWHSQCQREGGNLRQTIVRMCVGGIFISVRWQFRCAGGGGGGANVWLWRTRAHNVRVDSNGSKARVGFATSALYLSVVSFRTGRVVLGLIWRTFYLSLWTRRTIGCFVCEQGGLFEIVIDRLEFRISQTASVVSGRPKIAGSSGEYLRMRDVNK